MNRLLHVLWLSSRSTSFFLLLLGLTVFARAQVSGVDSGPPLITNVRELRSLTDQGQGCICSYAMEGTILAADNHSGTLFFQDDSGTEILEANLKAQSFLPGQRIQLRGTNYVTSTPKGLSLGAYPLVDSDNRHPVIERSGTVHLKAGRYPIQVHWFNWIATALLRVEYSSQYLPRQPIPDGALLHAEFNGSETHWLAGLNYRDFEGEWEKLPDFDSLSPKTTGVVSNFDIKPETRAENVGMEFKGVLKVPDEGNYTFYLNSDDGSQLFLCSSRPDVRIIGTTNVPEPIPVAGGRTLPDDRNCIWAKAEGTIVFLGLQGAVANIELVDGANHLHVEVLSAAFGIPTHLQHSRVRVRGICPEIRNTDGQKIAGTLVVADWQDVSVLEVAPESWSQFSDADIKGLRDMADTGVGKIVHLHGRIFQSAATQPVRFEDATGCAGIELLNGSSVESGAKIECLARWSRTGTNILLQEAVIREFTHGPVNETLTTALQVQQLTREQANRGLPVEIKGVVTWVSDDYTSLVIQDPTRAVFISASEVSSQNVPQFGDYCKIRGLSRPADFSPIVELHETVVLWHGQMPTPIKPTRAQLLSGSLDAQYVEIRGLVVATHDKYITLLTSDGTLDLEITPLSIGPLDKFLNSIVRVRGCLFATWNADTHRVILDQPLRVGASIISIDVPPPLDPFTADNMTAKELTQFDVHSDTFRRVKVSGQFIHTGREVSYMMDDGTGLRFQLAQQVPLDPGDKVEVVGLVELGGASPVLRQAVVRKTGHAPLPEARHIILNALGDNYDSTLVWLEGTLVDVRKYGKEQVLELQVGVEKFVARLNSDQNQIFDWPIGSKLKLTGVFSALNGGRSASRYVDSFELLLDSPTNVQVIARPPWWTLGRLLAVVGALIIGLMLTLIWISSLRRQVDRRTVQLHREISQREQAEKLRAIEQERSRIARDLHDDLGSELTEINMTAAMVPGLIIGADAALERLRHIVEKSSSMISSLDGVVWVINAKNDKLASLIEYLASYTEEFLAKAQIACRVELPDFYADRLIDAEIRHDVLLAVRETLNNAVRHGHPSEVLLQFKVLDNNLEITINDNGCGFDPNQPRGNGVGNLQQRMKKYDGSCIIQSTSGSGTSVILKLPLPK